MWYKGEEEGYFRPRKRSFLKSLGTSLKGINHGETFCRGRAMVSLGLASALEGLQGRPMCLSTFGESGAMALFLSSAQETSWKEASQGEGDPDSAGGRGGQTSFPTASQNATIPSLLGKPSLPLPGLGLSSLWWLPYHNIRSSQKSILLVKKNIGFLESIFKCESN